MKEKLHLDKSKLIPLIGGIVGILLIVFGGIIPSGESKKNTREEGYYEVSFYTETLEKKIESLCMSISGITEAEVLLTLDCSTEYVYAQNKQKSGSEGSESYTTDYLILNQGEKDNAVLLMEVYPKIRGIAVVCTGGNDAVVQQTVIDLLSAALGVSTNRIKVAGS